MPWISDADASLLRRAKAHDATLREYFRIKTQCTHCGYQSMDISPEQNAACPHFECSGGMEAYGERGDG